MSGLALANIKGWLTLSSNDTNKHEVTITCYAVVANYLLKRYATDVVVSIVDKSIRNFKQGSLTPWKFFQNSLDFTSRRGGVHNKQSILRIYVDGIGHSIRRTKERWCVDSRKATVEDFAHQAQCPLDLQGGSRKAAEKDGQCTEVVRRTSKGPRRLGKSCCTMAV